MDCCNRLQFIIGPLLILVISAANGQSYFEINVKTDKTIHVTDERFLSVALDANQLKYEWQEKKINLDNPMFNDLTKELSPAILRMGGTSADQLHYVGDDPHRKLIKKQGYGEYTSQEFKAFQDFRIRNGLDFLFDFNLQLRKEDGTWNETDAEELLRYCDSQKYDGMLFQLGNEPNHYARKANSPNPDIRKAYPYLHPTGKEHGQAFARLRKVLRKFPRYQDAILVGPDSGDCNSCHNYAKRKCKCIQYAEDLLQAAEGSVQIIGFHHYYYAGYKSSEELFLTIEKLDQLGDVVDGYKLSLPGTPVWLTETSSAWDSSKNDPAAHLADRFIASFLWVDKLGLMAAKGVDVVVRQTLYNGYYSLTDKYTEEPNPDFWISILYKRLVSTKVLGLTKTLVKKNGERVPLKDFNYDSKVRFYSHCAKNRPGHIVLFGQNMENSIKQLKLANVDDNIVVEQYQFTPPKGDLLSKEVELNDKILEYNGGTPKLEPVEKKKLWLKPYSVNFVVVPVPNGIC